VHRRWLAFLLPVCILLWTNCSPGHPAGTGGGTSGGGATGAVTAPAIVTLSSAQVATGVNIVVPPPASTPTPNAKFLGVNASLNSAIAAVTGDVIHQGTAQTVLMFGPGLSANMQISISGPSDISISGAQTVQSNGNPPLAGVAFTATVAANAALGARTVILQDTKDDITTFTGSLEVIP